MLGLRNRAATIMLRMLAGGLLLFVGYLFVGPANAGPLQDKIRTLTYSEAVHGFLEDTTLVYHDPSVGTLVAYLSPQRRVDIWHRHGGTLVSGRWGSGMVGPVGPNGTVLCFYVGGGVSVLPPPHNTGLIPGNSSRCYLFLNFSQGIHAMLQGDPYGLRRAGNAPAALPDARRYSAQTLLQLTGGNAGALRSVDLSR